MVSLVGMGSPRHGGLRDSWKKGTQRSEGRVQHKHKDGEVRKKVCLGTERAVCTNMYHVSQCFMID